MLKIRLQRVGRRNNPAYRVVVTPHTQGPKSGKNVELLGSYSPQTNEMVIKADRVKYWIAQGAKPSGTVHNLLVRESIIEGKKINVLSRKSPIIKPASPDASQGGEEKEEKEKEAEVSATAPAAEETPREETPEGKEAPVEDTPLEKDEAKEEAPEETEEAKEKEPAKEEVENKETKEEKAA